MYLVRRLALAFGVLGYSSRADVGAPIATEYVWGVPRLIAARFQARSALAEPEDESVGTASPSLGLQRLPVMRP